MIRLGITAILLLGGHDARAQEDPFGLKGTAPHELSVRLDSAENCEDCHGGFEWAPNDMWKGTMMANAVRDPLFQAALSIANQDIPEVGAFCLRCHTPSGYLEGRLDPADGSALIERDHEGITCDLCHRMELPSDGPYIGNAQMVVADDYARRGTIGSTYAPHQVVVSDFLESSELCGTCHEVSNPALGDFPIERTYSEWEASDFLTGESCQDCHMPNLTGFAADPGGMQGDQLPMRTLHDHTFVGGNTWIPEVLAGMYPELGLGPEYEMVSEAARDILSQAAELMIEAPQSVRKDDTLDLEVRVENLTGHKLPTGYPEGRRAWLELSVVDADGEIVFESGVYDHDVGDLILDEQARVYQAQLGTAGVLSYHMVEQDEVLSDTRIPPRGFRPDPTMEPRGIEFEILDDGSYAHWDMAPYALEIDRSVEGPLTVQARLWYQTTTRAYVEFLQAENYTDDNGDILMDAWETYGRDTPELIAETTTTIEVSAAARSPRDDEDEKKGCLCSVAGTPALSGGVLLFALVTLRRRRA